MKIKTHTRSLRGLLSFLLVCVFLALASPARAQVVTNSPVGGSGAVTIADGADVAQGATTDAACATDNGTCTIEAVLKRIAQRITSLITALGTPFQAGGSIANTTFASTQGTSPWVVSGGGTAGTAATGVVTIQGIAAMTKLLVTPDSVALPANQSVNAAQINGVTPLMGNGATGTGSQRVTIASDNTAFAVNSTLTAETTKVIGVTRQADGSGNLIVGDPCALVAKTYTPISITTATTTRIVAPTSAKKTYICYLFLTSVAADNIGIVEGTGGTCGTGTAGVIGGTTAANGPNFAANSGMSIGNGASAVAATAGTNVDLCLITSAATPLAGHIAWVQQ